MLRIPTSIGDGQLTLLQSTAEWERWIDETSVYFGKSLPHTFPCFAVTHACYDGEAAAAYIYPDEVQLMASAFKGVGMWENAMSQKERLEWAKARALSTIENGDLKQAVMTFVLDLDGYPETRPLVRRLHGTYQVADLMMNPDKANILAYINSF